MEGSRWKRFMFLFVFFAAAVIAYSPAYADKKPEKKLSLLLLYSLNKAPYSYNEVLELDKTARAEYGAGHYVKAAERFVSVAEKLRTIDNDLKDQAKMALQSRQSDLPDAYYTYYENTHNLTANQLVSYINAGMAYEMSEDDDHLDEIKDKIVWMYRDGLYQTAKQLTDSLDSSEFNQIVRNLPKASSPKSR